MKSSTQSDNRPLEANVTDLIRLRDLPGVQRITELCRNPRNFDYPQVSYSAEEIDKVSIGLFGIAEWATRWDDDDEDAGGADVEAVEFEEQFAQTRMPWPDVEPFWRAIGWDISDGQGGELISAHCFLRQIIAVAGDLVEGAKLTLDGSGTCDDEEPDEAPCGIEERLKLEADAFVSRRS